MIQDIDETLSRLLVSELSRIPGCPIRDPGQITLDSPATAESIRDGEGRVNLYLHDLVENVSMRDESYRLIGKPEEGMLGRRRGPVRMDLSYLVTVYAGDEPAAEHRLLAEVLGVFLRCLAAPVKYLAGSLEGEGSHTLLMEIAQPDHRERTDPVSIWQAVGGKLRPALSLIVTAPFDPFDTKWMRVVREAVLGTGPVPMSGAPGAPVPASAARVSIAGIVLDQEGETPIIDAVVTVLGRPEEAITDDRGFFFLANLPPGAQTVYVDKRGYARLEHVAEVPPPGRTDRLQPAVIALRRLTDQEAADAEKEQAEAAINASGYAEGDHEYRISISGRLRFPDGRTASYIPLRAGRFKTRSDADGIFSFSDVPAGERTVYAEIPGRGEVEVVSRNGAATIPDPARP